MEENISGVNEVVETDVQDAAELDYSTETSEETAEQPALDVQQEADNNGDSDHKEVKKHDTEIAFNKRLASARAKFEKDPLYQLGKMYAEQYGGKAEDAMNALLTSRVEELANDPRKLAEHVLRANQPVADVQNDRVAEMSQLIDEGILPSNRDEFNALIQADPEFSENVELYGLRIAAKMAQRMYDVKHEQEQRIAEKLTQNRQLPKTIRPSAEVAPKQVDPFSRSAEEHAKWREQMRREASKR